MAESDIRKVVIGYRLILEGLGVEIGDPHFEETPARAARAMFEELCVGLRTPPPRLTTFEMAKGSKSEMVISRGIPVRSLCAHHLLPFVGLATVAYIPHGRLLGLSKLSRIVEYWARRPQVQENLTTSVAEDLVSRLFDGRLDGDYGVGVVIRARHFCMESRGVNHTSDVTTSALRGVFVDPEVRAEFLKLSGG